MRKFSGSQSTRNGLVLRRSCVVVGRSRKPVLVLGASVWIVRGVSDRSSQAYMVGVSQVAGLAERTGNLLVIRPQDGQRYGQDARAWRRMRLNLALAGRGVRIQRIAIPLDGLLTNLGVHFRGCDPAVSAAGSMSIALPEVF